jgi:hypothetical protein
MRGAIPPLPQYVFMVWCLVKHRDNFTFTFYDTSGYENKITPIYSQNLTQCLRIDVPTMQEL